MLAGLAAVGFFTVNVGAAVVMLIPAILFSLSAVMMAITLVKVHKSLQKAQTEWSSGTWRNPPSREAQFNNFSGNSLPEYPTVPSYPSAGQWP